MPIAPGARIGSYEILAPLGAGGMGEVYRARDSRLGRDVAVKVLPESVSRDPELLARFDREARLLAAFQHPRIATVYGLEEAGSRRLLVMELAPGQTLADRLAAGALPIDETLAIARQIAEALEAAHEKGIVHRDLKPSNVQIAEDGSIKLLDFGLAKAFERSSAGVPADSLSRSPTISENMTGTGIILGTAAYMAPEQARGKSVDRRADLWSFGVVVYEMLTGSRLFRGDTVSDMLAAILRADPDWSALPADTPPSIRRLLLRCLARDPAARQRDAGDARLEIELGVEELRQGIRAGEAPTVRPARRQFVWVVAGALALAAAAGWVFWALDRKPPPAQGPAAARFRIEPPAGGRFRNFREGMFFGLSPDGSKLAFTASGSRDPSAPAAGPPSIWIREFSSLEAKPLPGTERASSLFWSFDGRTVAFFADGKLRRVDLSGGTPVTICDAPGTIGYSGSWGAGGDILFATVEGLAIYRVPAAGGIPEKVIEPDSRAGDLRYVWPSYLPDGKSFLYYRRGFQENRPTGDVMLWRPDSPPRKVAPSFSRALYVEPGFLLLVQEGTLVALPFDPAAGSTSGEPISLAERVRSFRTTGYAAFTASRGGAIVFQDSSDADRLSWFDRSGRETAVERQPAAMGQSVEISQDGSRALLDRFEGDVGTADIWIRDLARATEVRLTSDPESEVQPLWLPGGRQIVHMAVHPEGPRLVRRDLSSGRVEPLTPPLMGLSLPNTVSPDGATLIYQQRTRRGDFDLYRVALSGGAQPELLLATPFTEASAQFSPDGRMLAFFSSESGRRQAYVAPAGEPGARAPVSPEAAELLRWSRGGTELTCLLADGTMIAVPVTEGSPPSFGAPKTLFHLKPGHGWLDYDVSPDGRFLFLIRDRLADSMPLTVILGGLPDRTP